MPLIDGEKLLRQLPEVRGRMRTNADMSELTWFRVGGPAEVLFTPRDEADLADFLKNTDPSIPVFVVGVGSNLLVRDGGIKGVVIRLGRGFAQIAVEDETRIRAGSAVLDVRLSRFAMDNLIDGLTFFRGIPGTIGGALAMNAGAHGGETKDVLVEARVIDRSGNISVIRNKDMEYSYRHCGLPRDLIFTEALFEGWPGEREVIAARMAEITEMREEAQPVRSRTGGSTFKNPPDAKSWQLIDAAGMRGAVVGGAQVSQLHCNFLINNGDATASDIETLGENVREKVKQNSGVDLDWEIRRIGEKTNGV